MVRIDAAHGHVTARHRGGERPGRARRSGPRSRGARWAGARSPRAPSASRCPTPSILAPICCSIVQRSTISGSRAALSITVVPSASTAAMRMFSVAPTLGKSSQICAPRSSSACATTRPCSISVRRAELAQPGLVHVQRTGADGVAAGKGHHGAPAPRDQRPEHADRGPQLRDRPVVGLGPGLGRDVDRHGVAVHHHRGAEAAQHVGHQRHVEDLRAVGERRGALGQQRRRHQLQHAVLRPDHVDGAHEPVAAAHGEMLSHGGRRYRRRRPRGGRATVAPWPCT